MGNWNQAVQSILSVIRQTFRWLRGEEGHDRHGGGTPVPALGPFGIDLEGMDLTTEPGDDFAQYAFGKKLMDLTIPPDHAKFGVIEALQESTKERVREILEGAVEGPAGPGSEARKLGDYYSSFMDAPAIEATGLASIQPHLDRIAAIATPAQLASGMGRALRWGVRVPLVLRIQRDTGLPDAHAARISLGGLGLPNRDYYQDRGPSTYATCRSKYAVHMARMLALAGFQETKARAEAVLELEQKIAAAHWPDHDSRGCHHRYSQVKWADIPGAFPGFAWMEFLASAGLRRTGRVIFTEPPGIRVIAELLEDEPLGVWRDHLAFHTLKRFAPYLPEAFVREYFEFEKRALSGQTELKPRWKRGVAETTAALGDAIGKVYVSKYFSPETKRQVDRICRGLIKAMDRRLARLTWMNRWTRSLARAKLAGLTVKIGYPERWRSYAGLVIRAGDALGNALRSAEFAHRHQVEKLGKLADRREWRATAMSVNSFANLYWNEIVIPAGILQPPFFDPNADLAVNFGGIGAAIGHEIAHHFDDTGRRVDSQGFGRNWWSQEEVDHFHVLTDQMVEQYDEYEPAPGMHVDGQATLRENLSDLTGLHLALDAYRRIAGQEVDEVRAGFTGLQRFFLGYAQTFCEKYREPQMRLNLATNPHTPAHLRPNVVRNLDAWYEAFAIREDQALYLAPEARLKII